MQETLAMMTIIKPIYINSVAILSRKKSCGSDGADSKRASRGAAAYLEEVYLVTALVPSDTACLASSPGRSRRTAVWISRLVIVDLLL